MNNFFATDEEIKYAQDILLGKENHFSAEKIAVIKSNDSKDVVACPGSGKTTTLLAKLAILATRMPLEEGKGVCVLTHTNVAIDEIKSKLQSQADVLFSYPNYFERFKVLLISIWQFLISIQLRRYLYLLLMIIRLLH